RLSATVFCQLPAPPEPSTLPYTTLFRSGIVRDIISMGARPVAVMDQLRFGAIDHPDTARVVHGVVSGVGGYGNSLGLPNIGGETVFDSAYQTNPLVNALAAGVMRHE